MIRAVAGLFVLALVACDGELAGDAESAADDSPGDVPFVVMDASLQALREDFNDAAGSVRLVFISGPTCGICLRGLADLNAELLGGNTDPRLRTFVVNVPVLNATAEDARSAAVLIDNPHTRHYWEESGIIGQHYQSVLGIDYYAWDVWFIYGPQARWEGELPPEPAFWMHQLGPLPDDKYLDAEVFAAETNRLLASLPEPETGLTRVAGHRDEPVKVERIAQPAGVALEQHITGRGGYENLKAIRKLRIEGTVTTSSGAASLEIRAERGGNVTRRLSLASGESVATRRAGAIDAPSEGTPRGLPWHLEKAVLEAFDIEGDLVDWKAKGHELERTLDMVRLDGDLAWELDLVTRDGRRWTVYVDSHTGMIRRRVLLDDAGDRLLEMRYDDYRVAEPDTPFPSRFGARARHSRQGFYGRPGYVFPHRVTYLNAAGKQLAEENYAYIDVTFEGEVH